MMIVKYQMMYGGRGYHQWVEFHGWFSDWSSFASFKKRQRDRGYIVRYAEEVTP